MSFAQRQKPDGCPISLPSPANTSPCRRGLSPPVERLRLAPDLGTMVRGTWTAGPGRPLIDDRRQQRSRRSSDCVRQLGSTVVAPVPVDPLRRTSPAAYAPPEAFLPHGSVLTITRLVTRLAASRQLDALAALLRAHRIHVESAGSTTMPEFLMVLEVLADDQSRIQRHEEV